MTKWRYRIKGLAYFFNDDCTLSFAERRDGIVAALRNVPPLISEEVGYLDHVFLLEQSDDEEEFDDYWQDFYDWCDEYCVWVDTF